MKYYTPCANELEIQVRSVLSYTAPLPIIFDLWCWASSRLRFLPERAAPLPRQSGGLVVATPLATQRQPYTGSGSRPRSLALAPAIVRFSPTPDVSPRAGELRVCGQLRTPAQELPFLRSGFVAGFQPPASFITISEAARAAPPRLAKP